MMRLRLLLALLAAPAVASAQATPPASVVDCGAAGGGTVRGAIVRGGAEERAIAGGTVRLPDTPCAPATTDAEGRFAFRNVPPGVYLPTATASAEAWGDSLLAALEWVSIAVVEAGDTAQLEVGPMPFHLLEVCRFTPECAPLLAADAAAVAPLGEAERLREAVLRTAIALVGMDDGEYPPGWTACVDDDEAPAVLGALRARFGAVVPRSGCTPLDGSSDGTPLHERETGRAASYIWAHVEAAQGDLRLARLGYHTGPLNAMVFRCVLQHRDGQWVARACQLVAIS